MQVRVLSEEELKKESPEDLAHLVRNMRHLMTAQSASGERQNNMRESFAFHAELVLRHLRASSLPMRLWGWEQTEDLISLSHKHRWNAKSYLVEGAGTLCCNGVYRVSPEVARNDDAPKYTYQSKGGPLMTLFRCKMRTKAFWWFISEADATSPGTDKDVDYYQHKSNLSNDFMPWRTGWEAVSDAKSPLRGVNPPPTVTPVPSEGYLCPPGREHDTLEWELARWIVDNKVVEEIFGDSIHREVVGRSAKLLQFLSSMEDAFTTEHLDLIWSSCVGKAEPELQAVVYQLLTTLVECMKPELVVHLIRRLQESADGGAVVVLAFVECLAANQGHMILSRNKAVKAATPELLWSLLREPSVSKHKSCEAVTNFFAQMLQISPTNQVSLAAPAPSPAGIVGGVNAAGGSGCSGYLYHYKFLGQCIDFLREKARCVPPSGVLSEAEEAAVSRSLELVRFLLENFNSKHVGDVVRLYAFPARSRRAAAAADARAAAAAAAKVAERGEAPPGPHGQGGGESSSEPVGTKTEDHEEDGRATAATPPSPPLPTPPGDAAVLKHQVHQRLALIRYIHGLASGVNLSVAQLRGLWEILRSPAERELCLSFLQEGAATQKSLLGPSHTAFGDKERLFLFRELICKDVDWAGLGMPAYSCFDAFFKRIWNEAASAPAPAPAPVAKAETTGTAPAARSPAKLQDASAAAAVMASGGMGGVTGPAAASAATPAADQSEEDLTELGVDTLWRVTLTSLNQEVADSATNDLLEIYN
ncbi:unnamed protein product, partial [Hapterophycus canaliculatus]